MRAELSGTGEISLLPQVPQKTLSDTTRIVSSKFNTYTHNKGDDGRHPLKKERTR